MSALEEYRMFLLPYWCPDCEDEHEWDVGRGYSELDRELAHLADAAIAELEATVERLVSQPAIHKEYDFACPRCGAQAVLSFDLLPLEAEEAAP